MPEVLVIMGSKSDLQVAEKAADIFKKFGISYDFKVASAQPVAVVAPQKRRTAPTVMAMAL